MSACNRARRGNHQSAFRACRWPETIDASASLLRPLAARNSPSLRPGTCQPMAGIDSGRLDGDQPFGDLERAAIGRLARRAAGPPSAEAGGQSRQGGQQRSAAVDQLRMGRRQTLASLHLQAWHSFPRAGRRPCLPLDVDQAELGVDHVHLVKRKVGEIGRQLLEESTGSQSKSSRPRASGRLCPSV